MSTLFFAINSFVMFAKHLIDSDDIVVYPTFHEFSLNLPVTLTLFSDVIYTTLAHLHTVGVGDYINLTKLLEYYEKAFEKENVFLVDKAQAFAIPDAEINDGFNVDNVLIDRLISYQFGEHYRFIVSHLEIDICDNRLIIGGKCNYYDAFRMLNQYEKHVSILERVQRLVMIDNIIKEL